MESEIKNSNESTAMKVTWLGMVANLILSVIKAIAGVLFNSVALISDAGHSLSDLLSDFVTIWAIKISHKPKDSNHPYGHGRYETVGTLLIAVMLIAAGAGIIYRGFESIGQKQIPDMAAIWVAIISIVVKEALYQVSMRIGRKQKSRLLIANAWHHRTDAISSIVALLGIIGSRLGYPVLDPLAAIFVSGWIIKAGISIGYDALKDLTDTQLEKEILVDIEKILSNVEGVLQFHQLRARRMGSHILIDVNIEVRCDVSVSVSHQVAERVRRTILKDIPQVSDVLIHVDSENDQDEENIQLMRPQKEIETDILTITAQHEEIISVSHIVCHYLSGILTVAVDIELESDQTIRQAKAFVEKLKIELEKIPDIDETDIHLEL